jgi:hypothetical protein
MPRLISDAYQKLNAELHDNHQEYGGDGRVLTWVPAIIDIAKNHQLHTVLDYGCGKGDLKPALAVRAPYLDVREYDPAIPGKAQLPEPAEIVCCLDVMEHIEPEFLEAVLAHIGALTLRCCIMRVALIPAHKTLNDGRNAHLILESPEWWANRIQHHLKILKSAVFHGKIKGHAPISADFILAPLSLSTS